MSGASRPELAETVQEASQEQVHEVGEAFLWLCNQDAFLIDPPLTPATVTHAVRFNILDGDVAVRLDCLGGPSIYEHSVIAYEERLHKRITTIIKNGSGASVDKPRFVYGEVGVKYYQQNEVFDPIITPVYGNPEETLRRLGLGCMANVRKHMPSIQAALGNMFSVAHYKHLLWIADQFSMASIVSFGEEAVINKGEKHEE